MTTPQGEIPIAWRSNQELGTIDMVFPGDQLLPTRLSQIGDACVYNFTFSVPVEMPLEQFRQTQHNMDEELQLLKQQIESL